jgi:hypothetical protein
MGLEYFRKSCAAIKILKNSGNFKQNLRENTFFSHRIRVIQVTLYFRAVAGIAGISIMPAASVL